MPYTDFHYTPTGTGVISGKEVLEQTEDAINDLGTQISGDVQTAIDTANNALNTANTASADAQNAVNAANTAYTAATNAQNAANTAQNTASNALTAAQNAQNDVNALGNRVTTAENNISQNTNAITGLTTRMGTAEGNIGNLQTAVSTAQATANSAQQTASTARQQSYVFRYSSTALVASSTNSNALLDNTDNLKVGDKVIDSSGVLFSITAIDTANSTFTVGSALIDLAQDSDVVHKSGNENVGGIKTFSDDTYIKSLNFTNEVPSQSSSSSSILPIIATITYGDSSPAVQARLNVRVTADGTRSFYPHENNLYSLGLTSRRWTDFFSYHGNFAGQQQGDEYSGNARTNLTLLAIRDSAGQSGCVVDTFRENTAQGTGSHILGIGIKENSLRYEGCRFSWLYDDDNSGYVFSLRPTTQGTNQPIKYELGTRSAKWSTINGLNPGCLSLPDLNNAIDISGFITVGASTNDSYTAPADGYLSVILSGSSPCGLYVYNYTDGIFQRSNSITDTTYTNICGCLVPIMKNQTLNISSRVTDNIVSAKFFPCLGNV